MCSEPNDLERMKSEGDVNLSPNRSAWQEAALDAETHQLLDDDARYFLHQSLSTPCLNALARCEGIWIEDTQGRRYMDFHGNSVHQVGFSNPDVIAAVKKQLDELSFCTRRYTNRPAVALARKLAELAPLSQWHRRDRHGIEARSTRNGSAQDGRHVGLVPWRVARRNLGRRRASVPPWHWPIATRRRTRPAAR
jgi:hypothetical protein